MEGEWTEPERAAVKQMMQFSFIGSKETVSKGLQGFLSQTGVDEIMVASYIYDNDRKIYSYKLVSELFHSKVH
jgi:alkanesulfonate monooxygenase SsuD/methylene tetrahydromethanopterin reductase-like flavin-dependent oxidoreductase (luciferase family)